MIVKGPTLWDVKVPMRDGVELSADVYFPAAGPSGGPYPVLVERNCYNNQLSTEGFSWLTGYGYAVVLQDVRGRNDSGGDFYPIHQEPKDGYDTIEWAAVQPWSTGKVGSIGGSYMGWTQYATAKERPPSLKAMWASVPAGRFQRQEIWNNGCLLLPTLGWHNLTGGRAFQFGQRVDWHTVYRHLPLRDMDVNALGRKLPAWNDWMDHPGIDDFWDEVILGDEDFAPMDIPCVHAGGWWDYNQGGTLFFYQGMRKSKGGDHQFLHIGPWFHGTVGLSRAVGDVDFGEQAILPSGPLMLKWFDYWLKGEDNGVLDELPRSRIFVTGSNEWRHDDEWPPPTRDVSLYVRADGRLAFEEPSADEGGATYTYDPSDPVITVPGDWNFYAFQFTSPGMPAVPLGETALDLEALMARQDVLTYTTDPFTDAFTVVGVPWMVVHGSSDCPDTDWFAFIEDLLPDGRTLPLGGGQIRARFRESLRYETFMEPGRVDEFRFELLAFAHTFGEGHRIRIRLTSSSFPRFARNLNTDDPIATGTEMRVATNTVHHNATHPSHLVLPVLR